jgi:hypothetical protein
MCKIGDIIFINEYLDNGKVISCHSFVVINDASGEIQGLDYDIICNVMSSFQNEEHKNKKLKYYPKNYPVTSDDVTIIDNGNDKEGYIKINQFYYFNKEKIDYKIIGYLDTDIFNEILKFIEEFDTVRKITENL